MKAASVLALLYNLRIYFTKYWHMEICCEMQHICETQHQVLIGLIELCHCPGYFCIYLWVLHQPDTPDGMMFKSMGFISHIHLERSPYNRHLERGRPFNKQTL